MAARPPGRGLGRWRSAEGAGTLGNTIFYPGLVRGAEARSRGALQYQVVGSPGPREIPQVSQAPD